MDPVISILDTTYVLTYGVHRSTHTLCMFSAAPCIQYYRCTLHGVHHTYIQVCIPLLQAYLVARILWLVDVTCEHTRVVVVYMYTVPSLVVYVVVEYRCMHMHIPCILQYQVLVCYIPTACICTCGDELQLSLQRCGGSGHACSPVSQSTSTVWSVGVYIHMYVLYTAPTAQHYRCTLRGVHHYI